MNLGRIKPKKLFNYGGGVLPSTCVGIKIIAIYNMPLDDVTMEYLLDTFNVPPDFKNNTIILADFIQYRVLHSRHKKFVMRTSKIREPAEFGSLCMAIVMASVAS